MRRRSPLALAVAAFLPCVCLAATTQPQPPPLATVTAVTISIPLANVPASLAGDAAWTSSCINMGYYRAFSVFAGLSGAGTLQAQRYGDAACAIPVGAAVPSSALALTQGSLCVASSYCGSVGSDDGQPFLAVEVTLTDTSNSTNTIKSTAFLPGAE